MDTERSVLFELDETQSFTNIKRALRKLISFAPLATVRRGLTLRFILFEFKSLFLQNTRSLFWSVISENI